jgi:hypothetical protein
MERFVRDENIRRYRRLLETEVNVDKRSVIRKMLAEEESQLIASSRPRRDQSTHP